MNGKRELNEIWRPVVGFEGLYEVSNLGRVRSLDREIQVFSSYHGGFVTRRVRTRLLKQAPQKTGYRRISLHQDGIMLSVEVHRLVAAAFIGVQPKGRQVRHLDGTRTNDAAANLVYGSPKDNAADAIRHGTLAHSERHHFARLTREDVRQIRAARGHARQVDLATRYGIAQSNVSAIQLYKCWRYV